MAPKPQEDMPVETEKPLNPSAKEFKPEKKAEFKFNIDAPEFNPNKKWKRDELSSAMCHVVNKKDSKKDETEEKPLSTKFNLKLSKTAIYEELSRYTLTEEELLLNGFPQEDPLRRGRAIIRSQRTQISTSTRTCCRCGDSFEVFKSGEYSSATICTYHPKKKIPKLGIFPCCNGMSEGCQTWNFHVTSECDLSDVEFFKTEKHLFDESYRCIYALDCEMSFTTSGMEVVKIAVVDVDGKTVMDSLVFPKNPILDYNTQYSGVKEEDYTNGAITLGEVQRRLLKLVKQNTILVGHGLENDLKVLRMIHNNIVDTSVVFPNYDTRFKKSLKRLSQEHLFKCIQESANGHDPAEDARTCIELMLRKIYLDMQVKKIDL